MPDIDLKDPAILEAIKTATAAAVAEATKGFNTKLETETEGLKNKNSQLLSEVKKFKTKASALPDDFDPEKYAELVAAQATADEEAAKAAGKWDEYKAELVATHETAMTGVNDENKSLKGQLENVLVTNEIMKGISAAKGNSELLMPHVRKSVKLIDEDGVQIARVLDEKGNPRIAGASGDFMTIEQLLAEFKESDTYAPCFEGSRATGSGAGGGGNGAGGAKDNPFAKNTLNLTEQARLKRDDPDAAARLQAAAA